MDDRNVIVRGYVDSTSERTNETIRYSEFYIGPRPMIDHMTAIIESRLIDGIKKQGHLFGCTIGPLTVRVAPYEPAMYLNKAS